MKLPRRIPWANPLGYAFLIASLVGVWHEARAQSHSVAWHDEHGTPVLVAVYDSCAQKVNPHPVTFVEARQIYLCHTETHEVHELAHVAGMRHTAWWQNANGINCAQVIAADYDKHYRVGDLICIGPMGRGEWIEKANHN